MGIDRDKEKKAEMGTKSDNYDVIKLSNLVP